MDSEQATDFVSQLSPYAIGAIAALVVLLVVGLCLIFRKPSSHLTAFSADSGSVLVSRKALQELIKQTCLSDPSVEAARPTARIRKEKMDTRVDVRLSSPKGLKETCERLQGNISSLMERTLNFDQIGDIQIVVTSFKGEIDAPAQEASSGDQEIQQESSTLDPRQGS